MNGMLLAAGRGERMEPLSSLIPKPALDVLGRPLAAGAWDHLAPHCSRIVANLHRHADAAAAALATLASGGPPIAFSREAVLLGGAGGVSAARSLLGAGPVLVANADVWGTLDLAPLLADGDEGEAVLALLPHPDPQRWSSVFVDGDGRVRAFRRCGRVAGEPFLFTGFQRLGTEVVRGLPPPPLEFSALWRELQDRGALRGVVVRGSFREAGTPAAYRELVTSLLDEGGWFHERSEVAGSARAIGSAVGASCRVGERALLEHCVVTGGAEVSAKCTLRRCVVAGDVTVPPGTALEDTLILPGGTSPLR